MLTEELCTHIIQTLLFWEFFFTDLFQKYLFQTRYTHVRYHAQIAVVSEGQKLLHSREKMNVIDMNLQVLILNNIQLYATNANI